VSEQLFKMTSLCTSSDIKSVLPLVNYFIYCTLLQTSPRDHQLLPQLCYVLLASGRLICSQMQ